MPPRSKHHSVPAAPGETNLVIRNVTVSGRRTSVRMEPQIWDALDLVCERERVTPHWICTVVAREKDELASLTGAVRVFLLAYFRAAAGMGAPTMPALAPGALEGFIGELFHADPPDGAAAEPKRPDTGKDGPARRGRKTADSAAGSPA